MNDVYTYEIGDNLYLNLTNRCTNRCAFCVRDQNARYAGYPLWIGREPTAEEVIALIPDPTRYREIVFCGYGEPTYRFDAVKTICRYVRERGGKTRMNTSGHGSLIHGRDIVPEIVGLLDGVNISLNASCEEKYNALCRPAAEGAFRALLAFAASCKKNGVNSWFSVVDCIGEAEISRCRKIAADVGIPLRVREMIHGEA